jgi:hypothetical protein
VIYLILYSGLVITYVISLFYNTPVIEIILGVFALLSVGVSFPKATRLFKRTGSWFLAAGTVLMVIYELPILNILQYLNTTVLLIALFFVLPFMNSIIIIGRYDKNVNKLLKLKTESLGQLYYRSSITSYVIGMFLNIGMIPFVYQVLKSNLKDQITQIKSRFISQSMLRAYALCLVWSPMEILVGLSIDITGASYLQMLPFLLLISVILLSIDWAFGKKYNQFAFTLSYESQSIDKRQIVKSIVQLFTYLTLFISVIVLVQMLLNFNFLTTVTLVIVPYSFVWAMTIRKMKRFWTFSTLMWKKRTGSLQNYIALFLSVGFFIGTLRDTGLIEYLQYPFILLSEYPVFLFITVQIMFLGLAMAGFHPLVTMTVVGEAIVPALTVLDPISVGIVLITSGLSTVMSGPYNITVSLTSLLLDENPYRISLYNLAFAFLFSSLGTFIAILIQLF